MVIRMEKSSLETRCPTLKNLIIKKCNDTRKEKSANSPSHGPRFINSTRNIMRMYTVHMEKGPLLINS